MKSLRIVLVILSILTVSFSLNVNAATYQLTDSDGSVHSGENPANQVKHRSAGEVSDLKVYRVHMKTRFVVPSSGVPIEQLRVWHALPTKKEWSNTDTQLGGSQISWTPKTGQQQYEKSRDSYHIFWDETSLSPGSTLYFESHFTVHSLVRKFDPGSAPINWLDYSSTVLPDYDKRRDIHLELVRIADRIKTTNTPSEAVLEFCKWLSKNITYDASVPYSSTDVASALQNRRGHCGHFSELLIQLCNRAGIPIRQVFGLNLYAKDGITGGLQDIRSDYTNVHAWAEVYFPRVGWVEVEPSAGDQAFTIPARFIQNNKWFENCAIWLSQNGQWKQPEWQYQDGKYVSYFGIENIISYSEQTRLRNPAYTGLPIRK